MQYKSQLSITNDAVILRIPPADPPPWPPHNHGGQRDADATTARHGQSIGCGVPTAPGHPKVQTGPPGLLP